MCSATRLATTALLASFLFLQVFAQSLDLPLSLDFASLDPVECDVLPFT